MINTEIQTESIQKVWEKVFNQTLPTDKFIVVLGNSEWGEAFKDKTDLLNGWKQMLRRAWSQDIYLYYNGKCIRAVHNMSATVLGRLQVVGLCPSEMVKTIYDKKLN